MVNSLSTLPAVFLDRDGVINAAILKDGMPCPPMKPEDFQILPGVPEACTKLKKAGFLLVVATNQPDVGRGVVPRSLVDSFHEEMLKTIPVLDRVEACFHPGRGKSDCDCRKPKPGMLLCAAKELNIDLSQSWMVGDRWRDIDCGHAAGCRTIFIDSGFQEPLKQQPDFRAKNLPEAVEIILRAIGKAN
jgi:D-glycero-D-manno-heptose 1,7-bisphosphate phosphatase